MVALGQEFDIVKEKEDHFTPHLLGKSDTSDGTSGIESEGSLTIGGEASEGAPVV